MRTTVSRRKLGLGALGATLVGSGTAMADDRPRKQELPWTFAPVPVQGGTPGLGVGNAYHVFGGPGQEPATTGNFKGSVGMAFLNGNVTRTNVKTGEQEYLPFNGTDMRFMTGTFRGTDGKDHQGTFALV
jgi:hypothetical protein